MERSSGPELECHTVKSARGQWGGLALAPAELRNGSIHSHAPKQKKP